MKRFWCRTCQRIIRVRKLPPLDPKAYADEGKLQPSPRMREGQCWWHKEGVSHAVATASHR